MNKNKIDKKLPVIPIKNTVLFPGMQSKCRLSAELGEQLNRRLKGEDPFALALTVKSDTSSSKEPDELFSTGTLICVTSLVKSNEGYLAHVKAMRRISVKTSVLSGAAIESEYEFLPLRKDFDEVSKNSMRKYIMDIVGEISAQFSRADAYLSELREVESLEELIASIMPFLQVSIGEKQELLEIDSEKTMSMRFIDMLMGQKDSISFQVEMAKKFHEKVNKNQREIYLREQLKAIQAELSEGKGQRVGKKDYREQIKDLGMPSEVYEAALEQVDKLEALGSDNHEAAIIRNYLDLLIALPWKGGEEKELDLKRARDILDEDHYGMEEVKKRIMQHLAVMKLKKTVKGSILLFVGPPGTGKTSLGKSIARAMGRTYQRLSLGGVRDEAEIRGHRRTYIGALPGRIIQGMKKAGEKNPVFVLDEVDKLMAGWSGDPASALLEVLDPEQNNTFRDHYLEVPYDLSEVLFIATANATTSIPGPLLDRMEVIQMSGYTQNEKYHIARNHLIPAVYDETGLTEESLEITEEAVREVISDYTREAGVRGLKKELLKIARGVSEKILSRSSDSPYVVRKAMLREILGKKKVRMDSIGKKNLPGVVTGLAWTPVGGDILFIEASTMPGKGELILTGQLGDVMKESARISLSLIQSRMASLVSDVGFGQNDFHIHVPAGAIPKDGPSAGITLFTAIASLLLNKSVDSKLAMTGEITLRGSVLPVGGIKEKVLAARRAGIKKIILPEENRDDLEDVPEEVRKDLQFFFAATIEDVLKKSLKTTVPAPLGMQGQSKKGVVSALG